MPISKDGNNVIQETAFTKKDLFDKTGVAYDDQFAICDQSDVLKQLQFSVGGQTTNTKTTLALSAASNVTVTLPAITGTLATIAGATKASNATGTAGQIAYDGSYLYICTATDTWCRVAITGGY